MWNTLLRSVVVVALITFLVMTIRAPNSRKRKINFICFAGAILAAILLSMFRIENIFYTFPTAAAAAEYACKGEILGIVEGSQSSLVVYSSSVEDLKTMLIPKSASGYKLGNELSTGIIASDYSQEYKVEILNKGSDYFAFIYGASDVPDVSVNDNHNSQFFTTERISASGDNQYIIVTAFAVINDANGNYAVTVTAGEESITIGDFIVGG